MKTNQILSATLAAALIAGVAGAAQRPPTEPNKTQRPNNPPKADKWKGTATCTFTKDGKSQPVSASCFGQFSYESAKRALEASIKAQVNTANGNIQGSITFSISKEF
jgi:hypothetical protein